MPESFYHRLHYYEPLPDPTRSQQSPSDISVLLLNLISRDQSRGLGCGIGYRNGHQYARLGCLGVSASLVSCRALLIVGSWELVGKD